jgi:RNA 2',3'-cyclic 3'-phosphodiesterase
VRCFVGVWVPAEVRDELAAVHPDQAAGVRWVAPERWHVTLAFAGEVGDPAVRDWAAVVRAGAARLTAPLEAVLGPATMTLGRAVLCVPVHGLDTAAAAVREEAVARNLSFDPKPFVGHLTLARARGKGGRVPKGLEGQAMAARWPVFEVSLVASRTTKENVWYETLTTASAG